MIDNVNAIDSDELRSEIKELCRRKKLWVIILGRSMMPSWLYDTVVTCHMLIIPEEDLALNEEGIDKYMRSEGIILSEEELRFQRKCCEGNPFGVKYAAQQLLAGNRMGKIKRHPEIGCIFHLGGCKTRKVKRIGRFTAFF